MNIFTTFADGNFSMNTEQLTKIEQTNRLYIELGRFEDALHMVRNLWIHQCVVDLLEQKIKDTKAEISRLENNY